MASIASGIDSLVVNRQIDVVIIGGGFFGYAAEISRALTARGLVVQWFEDRPALDTVTKTVIRLAPSLIAARAESYFCEIIEKIRHSKVQDVLVIKGETLSPNSIERLRAALPSARFTLYFWDSYKNMPRDSRQKVDLFDKIFTFDPKDAESDRRLSYRPLFFVDDYARIPKAEIDIDVLFLGTVHSDRYSVIHKLTQTLPHSVRFTKVLYFPSLVVYAVRRVADPSFWGARHREFIFQPMNKTAIQALIARSRIVLDIERSVQCGYTMRTIEMLGAGRKLVTTNATTKYADFFNPNNICVIDRHAPAITPEFLESQYEPLNSGLLSRYSLSGWLDEVLPSYRER